jgi:hypothetical protein
MQGIYIYEDGSRKAGEQYSFALVLTTGDGQRIYGPLSLRAYFCLACF